MITYLIYSTISLGLLLLIYHLLLENEKMHHINRGYLLFSLIFSLTIPLIPVGIGDQLPEIVQSWISDNASTTAENVESEPALNYTESEIPDEWMNPVEQTDTAKGLPVFPLILSLYGFVSLLLFARLFRVIHIIQMKADRNPRKLYQNCELVLLREKIVPHTFMNTIFVNKAEYKSGRIGRDILTHEQTHAAQKHTFDLLFIEVLKAVFWFNPLLYLYKKAMLLNHEFLADQAVINSGFKVNEYQSLLLNTLLLQPTHGLSHSFTFSLTKKRLEMMTKSTSPLRSAIKTFAIIPLFFTLGFLFGCESTPADSANNQMDIQIEFTDSELIIFNGDEIPVSELEAKLESLSDRYELHFFLENHPEMLAGPVMSVNSLVQIYRSGDQNLRENNLTLTVTEDSEIMVNGQAHSLEELETVLNELISEYNPIVNMRVERGSDTHLITEVQQLLRQYQISRINYSTLNSSPTEDELFVQLNRAVNRYMAIPPEPANLEDLIRKYEEYTDVHDSYYEEQKRIYRDDPSSLPPPPPMAPSPQIRINNEIEKFDPVSPTPPPPPVDPRNVLQILVNAQGMVLISEQPATIHNVREHVKQFIDNNGVNPDLSESPNDAIVSIKTGRTTPYNVYIDMLDEVLGAYEELRNTASMNRFGVPFDALEADSNERELIRELYPRRISAARPQN